MCGCKIKSGSRAVLQQQGFTTIVPKRAFYSANTYADFMMYRCMNEEKFLKALSTLRYQDTTLDKKIRSQEDVKKLALMADNGEDIQMWNVSLKKVLGSIYFTPEETSNVECKFGLSTDD